MTFLTRLSRGIWDFVVGDDPLVALVVVIAIAVTAALAGVTHAAWCVLPAVTLVVLAASLRRAS